MRCSQKHRHGNAPGAGRRELFHAFYASIPYEWYTNNDIARYEGMPETHDGSRAIRFRVAFSEHIGISYRSLREDAFKVTGRRSQGPVGAHGARTIRYLTTTPRTGDTASSDRDVSSKGVEAWAVGHEAGIQHQDVLVERLGPIISKSASL